MEYLLLIQMRNGKTKHEMFWTREDAVRRKKEAMATYDVHATFLFKAEES